MTDLLARYRCRLEHWWFYRKLDFRRWRPRAKLRVFGWLSCLRGQHLELTRSGTTEWRDDHRLYFYTLFRCACGRRRTPHLLAWGQIEPGADERDAPTSWPTTKAVR